VVDCSEASGCLVGETSPNSYQSGFAAAGGGVWAAQFDYTGCVSLSVLEARSQLCFTVSILYVATRLPLFLR
jgi:hypothetical protein